jgi:hypothetical protein
MVDANERDFKLKTLISSVLPQFTTSSKDFGGSLPETCRAVLKACLAFASAALFHFRASEFLTAGFTSILKFEEQCYPFFFKKDPRILLLNLDIGAVLVKTAIEIKSFEYFFSSELPKG